MGKTKRNMRTEVANTVGASSSSPLAIIGTLFCGMAIAGGLIYAIGYGAYGIGYGTYQGAKTSGRAIERGASGVVKKLNEPSSSTPPITNYEVYDPRTKKRVKVYWNPSGLKDSQPSNYTSTQNPRSTTIEPPVLKKQEPYPQNQLTRPHTEERSVERRPQGRDLSSQLQKRQPIRNDQKLPEPNSSHKKKRRVVKRYNPRTGKQEEIPY